MTHYRLEPTIDEIMGDPMVRALMKADRVEPEQFEHRLRRMAGDGSRLAGDRIESRSAGRFLPRLSAALDLRCCG